MINSNYSYDMDNNYSGTSIISIYYSINEIYEKILYRNVTDAIAIYEKTILDSDFSETLKININFFKSYLYNLEAIISYFLLLKGCNALSLEKSKLSFYNHINSKNKFKCLYKCGISIIKTYSKLLSQNNYNHTSKPIKDTILYIQDNFNKKITIEDICKEVNFSRNYLSTLFKKETGITITEYLTRTRINYSKHLLINSNLSLLEIALEAGFEGQSYFTRVFKKEMNMTPKQFRKNGGNTNV